MRALLSVFRPFPRFPVVFLTVFKVSVRPQPKQLFIYGPIQTASRVDESLSQDLMLHLEAAKAEVALIVPGRELPAVTNAGRQI